MTTKVHWIIGGVITAGLVGYCTWLVLTDAPAYQFLVRLYVDKRFLKQTLREWGILAPVIFIGLQALQVIIAPIPGELTGILGGYLFGQWVGLFYSTIGLTVGSVAAFAVGGGSALITFSGWSAQTPGARWASSSKRRVPSSASSSS